MYSDILCLSLLLFISWSIVLAIYLSINIIISSCLYTYLYLYIFMCLYLYICRTICQSLMHFLSVLFYLLSLTLSSLLSWLMTHKSLQCIYIIISLGISMDDITGLWENKYRERISTERIGRIWENDSIPRKYIVRSPV